MTRKKKKIQKNKTTQITKGIFTVLEKHTDQSFNYKQIAAKLGITDTSGRNLLIKKLAQLKASERILEPEKGKYKALKATNYITGVVDITSKGNAYVITDDLEQDVFIPANALKKALHKDTVEIYVYPPRRGRNKIEGEVVNILERHRTEFVGIIHVKERFAFVVPTDFRMYTDIFVPKAKIKDAQTGDKVIVTINDWPDTADSPYGAVLEVLGTPGEHNTEIHSILAEYGLPYRFEPEIEAYANQIDTSIQETEIAKRRDMRDTLTFTIDPKDAKDFDDALSFKLLPNGNYEIGVHIADVSHYLQPDTILDDEAYRRATSVYLVDRVVPMLPEILSNNACSLRPLEQKYTFSAVFEITPDAKIVDKWFGKTVTYSDARFAYEEAQVIIETQKGDIPADISLTQQAYSVPEPITMAILEMDAIAKKLRTKRMREGAISFDKVEVKFHLDKDHVPTGVYFKESKDANKLIEEFMLLANRKVAEFIGKQKPKKPFVYRVHDEPNEEKLNQLQGVISRFGYKIDMKSKSTISNSLNSLLKQVQGKKEQNMVDTLTIRSMSKAVYTTENIGHYGLSFAYYSHFTSPIRRYPDVMTHRLLQYYLENGNTNAISQEDLEEKCKHSSSMEGVASSAERDSIKYMQIKFMEDRRDQEFIGVISGVTEWGMYVEIIDNKCEGLVRIREIKDDYYVFDEQQYALVGERKGNRYQLGDPVVVQVKSTDLVKRHLDFALLGKYESSSVQE